MDVSKADKIRDRVEILSDVRSVDTDAFDNILRYHYTKEQLLAVLDLYDSGLEDTYISMRDLCQVRVCRLTVRRHFLTSESN